MWKEEEIKIVEERGNEVKEKGIMNEMIEEKKSLWE